MDELEWHAKLLEWAGEDKRLRGMTYQHIDALQEHLAQYEAAQQSAPLDDCRCIRDKTGKTVYYNHSCPVHAHRAP